MSRGKQSNIYNETELEKKVKISNHKRMDKQTMIAYHGAIRNIYGDIKNWIMLIE